MSKCFYFFKRVMGPVIILLLPLLSFAQKTISGKVVSMKDQAPLPGVSIIVKGTKTGAASNAEGLFAINAKHGDVLVLTGVTVKTTEVVVNGDDQLTIEMEQTTEAFNEVVVTALG